MAGAAKNRANREREQREHEQQVRGSNGSSRQGNGSSRHGESSSRRGNGSSSGETSSSGKATSSARSRTDARSVRSHRSTASRRTGYDGNRDPQDERDPAKSRPIVDPKNIDLPAGGWGIVRGYEVQPMPSRPLGPSSLGAQTKIGLNTFNVESMPTKSVYQFEVMIGSGAEKRGLIKKVWQSKTVQQALGKGWIFDGNRLAWSMHPIEREHRLIIDLDQEENRTPRAGKENKHRVAIRQTNRVGFNALVAYLEGKCSFDNTCLEG